MNVATFTGILVTDPKIGNTSNGTKRAVYKLAVRRSWVGDTGQDTDFILFICYGQLADYAERFFIKGMRISTSGEYRVDESKAGNGMVDKYHYIHVDKHSIEETKTESDKRRENRINSIPGVVDYTKEWAENPKNIR